MMSSHNTLRACLVLAAGSLAIGSARAETVIWQLEGVVQGIASPFTTDAYFPRPLAAGEKVSFRFVVDTATPPPFLNPTDTLYPGAIKSAVASGSGWSIAPASLAAGSIEVRNEDPPGWDTVFFNATSPGGQGQTWYSFQPTLSNIDASGGPGPLSSVAIPASFTSLAAWNNAYFYFSARRDEAGQPVDGATYFGQLTAVLVTRDSDNDGILDPADNCPGAANADQADSNADGYGDACVHPTVRVPSSASIDHFVLIARNTIIEKQVVSGAKVVIGTSVRLGQGARIDGGATIGDFSRLEQAARVGANSAVGSDVTLGQNVVVSGSVMIGSRTKVDQGAVICPRATIGESVRIRQNALVQSDALVPAGASVPGRATVPTAAMCNP